MINSVLGASGMQNKFMVDGLIKNVPKTQL